MQICVQGTIWRWGAGVSCSAHGGSEPESVSAHSGGIICEVVGYSRGECVLFIIK